MAYPSPGPREEDDIGAESGLDSPPGTPRWVKTFGIIILLLILAFVILKLAGIGGDHGPGSHTSSDGLGRLALSHDVVPVVEVQSPDTEGSKSIGAHGGGGRTASSVEITASQVVHDSIHMDTMMQRLDDVDSLNHLTQGLTEKVQA